MQTLELTPELGVPIPPDLPYIDLRERAEAACRAIDLLAEHGYEVPEATLEDKQIAATVTAAYAADSVATSQKASTLNTAQLTPASLQNIRSYLDEFGRAVVLHATEVRHLVTNRLLEESNNPDPRIRIRALELLGKVSDVGLFTEKQEITITHQTTDELRERLRSKLQRLVRRDSSIIETDSEVIDVDAELNLEPKDPDNVLEPEKEPWDD